MRISSKEITTNDIELLKNLNDNIKSKYIDSIFSDTCEGLKNIFIFYRLAVLAVCDAIYLTAKNITTLANVSLGKFALFFLINVILYNIIGVYEDASINRVFKHVLYNATYITIETEICNENNNEEDDA